VLLRLASADYFSAMGIRLAQGRFFDGREAHDPNTHVAVVNDTFARTFWPGVANPVGRRFRSRGKDPQARWFTVVGVAKDVKHYGLEQPMRPGIYLPLREYGTDNLSVVLHTRVEPQSLVPGAEALMRELDPEIPLFNVRTMEQALTRSLRIRSLYSWMLGVFAALALLLALGGTYGVSAYLVTQRRREMAIRMALGARAADIFRAVLGGSLGVAAAGVLVGVGASLLTGRLLATLLFGVTPHDMVVLGSVVGLLLATALVANYWPARRASRVDPMSSLRAE
jgi:predicted permease